MPDFEHECSWGFTERDVEGLRKVIVEHPAVYLALFGDGNGNKGLIRKLDESFTRADERDMQKNKRDQEIKNALQNHYGSQMRWIALMGVIIAILTAAIMWLGYIETLKRAKDGTLNFPKITMSDSLERVYAKNQKPPQDAGSIMTPNH